MNTPGAYNLTYRVTDSASPTEGTASRSFRVTVRNNCPLALPSVSNRTYDCGTSVSVTLPAASGGTTPYLYSLSGTGSSGLSLSGRTMSGTVDTPGTYRLTYKVTDSASPTAGTASRSFTVTVRSNCLSESVMINDLAEKMQVGRSDEFTVESGEPVDIQDLPVGHRDREQSGRVPVGNERLDGER